MYISAHSGDEHPIIGKPVAVKAPPPHTTAPKSEEGQTAANITQSTSQKIISSVENRSPVDKISVTTKSEELLKSTSTIVTETKTVSAMSEKETKPSINLDKDSELSAEADVSHNTESTAKIMTKITSEKEIASSMKASSSADCGSSSVLVTDTVEEIHMQTEMGSISTTQSTTCVGSVAETLRGESTINPSPPCVLRMDSPTEDSNVILPPQPTLSLPRDDECTATERPKTKKMETFIYWYMLLHAAHRFVKLKCYFMQVNQIVQYTFFIVSTYIWKQKHRQLLFLFFEGVYATPERSSCFLY